MGWIKITPETMPPDGELVTLKCYGIRGNNQEYEYSVFGKYDAEHGEFLGVKSKNDTVEYWCAVGPRVKEHLKKGEEHRKEHLKKLEKEYDLEKIRNILSGFKVIYYDYFSDYIENVCKMKCEEHIVEYMEGPTELVIHKEDIENVDTARLWQLYALVLKEENERLKRNLESKEEQRKEWYKEAKKFEHALKIYDVDNAREHIAKKIAKNIVNGFLPGYKLVEKDKSGS